MTTTFVGQYLPGERDPLKNLPRAHRTVTIPAAYPPVSTARQIVLDFLRARVNINNARMAFIADPTPTNMTAWTNAEEHLSDLHDTDYYPPVPDPTETAFIYREEVAP